MDTAATPEVRIDFVPAHHYTSCEFAREEKARLWPRVWQLACREEELVGNGSYVTYDIADQSVVVVRTSATQIKAYHNVCLHRGRRLTEGCGTVSKLHCRYHGWQWSLDGQIARVLDRPDWQGCPNMGDADLRLREVKVDTWAGFVFVNLDLQAEPLATYLAPVPEHTDCYEFEKMRYRWYKSVRVPCNWKVALEAFNEGYHVFATHPQVLDTQGDDVTRSFAFGKHGMFGYPTAERMLGAPSTRTGKPVPADIRPGVARFFQMMEDQLKAIFTWRDNEATRRILTECTADMAHAEVLGKAMAFQREAAIASGAGWPDITPEQMAKAGTDWHVFPNMVFLMYPDGMLFYRARPDGDDPDSCIFDICSIARYAPGAEPKLEREFYMGVDDWKTDTVAKFGAIVAQDFSNMAEVQRGMKSMGFPGARPNPLQESAISNFHQHLRAYLFDGRSTAGPMEMDAE